MPAKYRNIFLIIGVTAIAVMLISFDMSWHQVWNDIRRAGFWLPAVIALWVPIYMMNAWSWQLIINDGTTRKMGYWRTLKYTITGYALNNVTPVGLLGGEPYRIMELSPFVGRAKAASSVILYAMMHIFSHFCFWLFSIVLFLAMYSRSINWETGIVLLLATLFCLLGFYFFLKGYRNGLAMRVLQFFGRWPLIGHHIRRLAERHAEGIRKVDQQIADLHAQRRSTFHSSLFLEFLARMVGCFEIQFILFIFTPDISYWDCVLIQAFMSLFANLFFFMPMQMGSKEGGLAIAMSGMHMASGYGVLTGLITRIRELFWIAVGLLLIRFGNKK